MIFIHFFCNPIVKLISNRYLCLDLDLSLRALCLDVLGKLLILIEKIIEGQSLHVGEHGIGYSDLVCMTFKG